MVILLTDSQEIYDHSESNKFLTDGFVLLKSDLYSDSELLHFNAQLNGVENEASRKMIEELEMVCTGFPDFETHPFLETRKSTYNKAYSLLYANFKDYIAPKYLLELLAEKLSSQFTEPVQFLFILGEQFTSARYSDFLNSKGEIQIKSIGSHQQKRTVKQLFYRWSRLKRKISSSPKNRLHIALFLFDTANDIDLFRSFFERVIQDTSVYLSIIQIESGVAPEKAVSAKPFECENIRVYKLQDFRAPLIGGIRNFQHILKTRYPQYSHFINNKRMLSFETYSAFFHAALSELQPQVALYDNTGEVGRYMTDVARYLNIKSANIEYGLFSNDFIHMASNICYDVRYCLGEASVSIWKDKKDPSLQHIPIGFLKLDQRDHASESTVNLKGTYDKLILFASTWAGTNSLYNLEKTIVVKELSEMCSENNWALIIKKHPAEKDTLLDELEIMKQPHVFLYQHNDMHLFQLLKQCDIVCTQNSSITAEALIHEKPTVFYNKSEQPGLAELIPMSSEPFVFFVNSKEQFLNVVATELPKLDPSVYNATISHYLFKTDGRASLRLLNEIKALAYGM